MVRSQLWSRVTVVQSESIFCYESGMQSALVCGFLRDIKGRVKWGRGENFTTVAASKVLRCSPFSRPSKSQFYKFGLDV